MARGGDPYRARRWREQGSEGSYGDMDPAVQPDNPRRADEPPEAFPPAADAPFPTGGSVRDVLAWVGESVERAKLAHAEEMQRLPPRSTVLAPLERLIAS